MQIYIAFFNKSEEQKWNQQKMLVSEIELGSESVMSVYKYSNE